MPTEIYFGRKALLLNSEKLRLGSRAFIVTGRHSGRASGALADIENTLGYLKIDFEVYDRITNNPTVEECYEAGRAAREFEADFIIGVGGGSPLDAAKAIAVYAVNDIEPEEIFEGNFKNKPLPMAAVPTTAGTGSEVTPYSVLTSHTHKTKKSFSTPDTFYKVAFVDGRYIMALPEEVLKNTAVDAMSHLIEGYTNKRANPFTDPIALEGLCVIGDTLDELKKGEMSEERAEALIFASTLGGIVIAETGTTVVHSMGYPLTYFKGIPHGRANGILLPEYLKKTAEVLPEKTENILSALHLEGIGEFKKLLTSLLETSESFSKEEVEKWLETTVKAKNAAVCPFDASLECEREIFYRSLELNDK